MVRLHLTVLQIILEGNTLDCIPPTTGRQSKSTVIYEQPGVTRIAKQTDDWLKCRNFFSREHVIVLTVNFTKQNLWVSTSFAA